MLKKLSLEETVVVITGAGTGLGKEMALAIAQAGAHLVIAARRSGPINKVVEEIRIMGGSAIAVTTDVAIPEQVNLLFATALKKFGKVDVLFNNAGIVREHGGVPIWDITDEDWRIGVDTNLSSAFYCSRAVSKHMVSREKGKIINVSSGFGLRGGRDNYMYACSKGGIIQLTRTLATSLGRYGITSNCLVPGYFLTEGTRESKDNLPKGEFIPVGRIGRAEEVGPCAVFLASGVSDYMNGQSLIIDGGGLSGGCAPTHYSQEIPVRFS